MSTARRAADRAEKAPPTMDGYRDIVPLILAAGRGSRIGGNKALLDLDGKPAITRVLEVAAAAGAGQPIVVVGHEAGRVRAVLAGRAAATAATVVENPAPDRGQTSSVQAGLAAVPDDVAAALVWPVDHALVGVEDIAALLEGARSHPEATAVLPSHRGKTGHPALLRRVLFPAILALPPATPLHTVVRAERERTHFVERPTDAVLRDLDTRDQVIAALGDPAEPRRGGARGGRPRAARRGGTGGGGRRRAPEARPLDP